MEFSKISVCFVMKLYFQLKFVSNGKFRDGKGGKGIYCGFLKQLLKQKGDLLFLILCILLQEISDSMFNIINIFDHYSVVNKYCKYIFLLFWIYLILYLIPYSMKYIWSHIDICMILYVYMYDPIHFVVCNSDPIYYDVSIRYSVLNSYFPIYYDICIFDPMCSVLILSDHMFTVIHKSDHMYSV